VNGIEDLPGIDPSKAHVARMYDYYLGGNNNFESDRVACMELDKLVPGTRGLAINNRKYLVRVVRTLARDSGLRRVPDLGGFSRIRADDAGMCGCGCGHATVIM
jgi:hypothetical protein